MNPGQAMATGQPLNYGLTARKGVRRCYFGPLEAAGASELADELRSDGWDVDVMFHERIGT